MNKVVADFAAMLDAKKAKYELHTDSDNVIRFRTGLPNNEAYPLIFFSYHEENGSFVMLMSELFKFSGVGIDMFQVMNDFNFDPSTFNCKMFITDRGELTVACNSFIEGDDPLGQINEYISLMVRSVDNYYPRIKELVDNSQNK